MWILTLIVVLLVIFDQLTKYLVEIFITSNGNIDLIPNFLYFTKTYNRGAAWSSFADSTGFLFAISIAASLVMIYFLVKCKLHERKLFNAGLVLALAGCYGNLIDRGISVFAPDIRYGVVDFIGVYLGSYRFPIFNVADSCLVIGTILIAIDIIFLEEKRKNKVKE